MEYCQGDMLDCGRLIGRKGNIIIRKTIFMKKILCVAAGLMMCSALIASPKQSDGQFVGPEQAGGRLTSLEQEIASKQNAKKKTTRDWGNAVVYEMNVRQYTPEGTFAAAQKHLPRLKELGIDVVWLMPIYPIGEKGRKGTLGSYYAIADYEAVNPEFGTMKDFEKFLKEAHKLGLKVILDCVANHTSPDAKWINERPADWYVRDAQGNTVVNYDWTDIAELNYDNKDVWDAMEAQMRFWMQKGLDGFRCDMACEVPLEFWQRTISSLRKDYPDMYMLAEGEEPKLHTLSGFNTSYAWELHHLLNDIAQGKKGTEELVAYIEKDAANTPEDAMRLCFTSNHDENSWAGTEFKRMGEAVKAMTVLNFTLPKSQPLLYTGQEIGWDHSFEFFEKDPIPAWTENEYTDFYKNLIAIRHRNPALAAGGKFELLKADEGEIVYRRYVPGNEVRVRVELQAPWDYEITEKFAPEHIARVEPPCWWTGMNTQLQLMVNGPGIGAYEVTIEGGKGVKVSAVHKADSPNYLFVDVEVSPKAKAGTYTLVFSKDGQREFTYPYEIGVKSDAERHSFTSADMIYLIMPDRFANGDPTNDNSLQTSELADRQAFFGRHGGDLRGLINHLDYISDLGATAIWCTPLLEDNAKHESYHGYACTDYYNIDPRYGSNELYKEYVDKAHEKGLKVVMDIVTNHCGTEHWWMNDLPFKDWIHVFPEYTGTNICFSTNMDPNASLYDLNLQESGWFVPAMPDMNLDNPFVLNYFKQWAAWWVEYAGLDGLRVDTYPYNEKRPMSEWCKSVREEYPWINIVGECWTSSIPELAYWQADNRNKDGFNSNLPSVMDFPLRDAIVAALCEQNPGWGQGMTRVYDILSHDFVYENLDNMLIFVGNHDTNRIGDDLKGDANRVKIAMTLMATMRGIPQVFAGDEIMTRSANPEAFWEHGGLRADFKGGWQGDTADYFTEQGRAADPVVKELFDYSSTLFNWRKGKEVLHTGSTLHFMTRDNTYAYFRYNGSDIVFVYINNSNEAKTIPWDHYAEIAADLGAGRNVLTGDTVNFKAPVTVAPASALVVEF